MVSKDRCNDGLIEEDDDDDGYVSPHIQIPTIRPETSLIDTTTTGSDCENHHNVTLGLPFLLNFLYFYSYFTTIL